METINYEELKEVTNSLKINSFYQYVSRNNINNNKDLKNLVKYLDSINIDTYLLCGSPSYAYDDGLDKMKNIIDEVVKFNTENSKKINGIVFDVEFYLESNHYNDNTKKECYKSYLNNMNNAYEYSRGKDIEFIIVIPYWLDTTFGYEELENLICSACDSVEIMNYYKSKSIEHVENEINIARKYDKNIVTISELQEADGNSITDKITFYNDGLSKCKDDMENILNHYDYDKLGYAYHEYNSLIKLYFDEYTN